MNTGQEIGENTLVKNLLASMGDNISDLSTHTGTSLPVNLLLQFREEKYLRNYINKKLS